MRFSLLHSFFLISLYSHFSFNFISIIYFLSIFLHYSYPFINHLGTQETSSTQKEYQQWTRTSWVRSSSSRIQTLSFRFGILLARRDSTTVSLSDPDSSTFSIFFLLCYYILFPTSFLSSHFHLSFFHFNRQLRPALLPWCWWSAHRLRLQRSSELWTGKLSLRHFSFFLSRLISPFRSTSGRTKSPADLLMENTFQ